MVEIREKGNGNKLKIVIIILLVLIIVGTSSFAAWFLFFNKKTDTGVANNANAKTYVNAQNQSGKANTNDANAQNLIAYEESEFSLPLDEFLVNLSDEGGQRYLKVKMVLGYNTKEKKKLSKELEEKKHIVRDTINSALRSRKANDFLTQKSLDEVKREIINRVNGNLQYGRINNVFITDILVQ